MAMQMKSNTTNMNPSAQHSTTSSVVNSQHQLMQQQQVPSSWSIVNVQLRNEPIQVRPTSPLLKSHRESLGYGQAKGLLNGPGQNNCFLNCAVQVSAKDIIILLNETVKLLFRLSWWIQ